MHDAWIATGPTVNRKQFTSTPLRGGRRYGFKTYDDYVFSDDAAAQQFLTTSAGQDRGRNRSGKRIIRIWFA